MWGYRTCRVAGVRALRALVRPSHPHVGLLFRVWATPPMYGTGGPRAGQAARVWNRRPACGRRGAALHQARCNARKPAISSLGLLIRTWACCSEPGQPRPCTGQAARVRNRQPACERRGAALHQARCNARKPAMWSLGLLIRTWACCSESGRPRPCTGQVARVRNRRPACGTRWSPSRCCMRPIRICACCRWGRAPHRLALQPS